MEALALKDRENQIFVKGESTFDIVCNKDSLAGAVSQRACVFCGSRVVLYPIADALHLVHGPIGCAVYTWDIRGALSSGPELHRLSFSTDLQELDVVFGGEKKLAKALDELIDRYQDMIIYKGPIASIFAPAIGNYTYILRSESEEPLVQAARSIIELRKE